MGIGVVAIGRSEGLPQLSLSLGVRVGGRGSQIPRGPFQADLEIGPGASDVFVDQAGGLGVQVPAHPGPARSAGDVTAHGRGDRLVPADVGGEVEVERAGVRQSQPGGGGGEVDAQQCGRGEADVGDGLVQQVLLSSCGLPFGLGESG